jgi:hypothetical protein
MRHPRKTGDCSRKRRLYGSPAQIRWNAPKRAERFARRFGRHWHLNAKAPKEGRNPAMTTIQRPRQAAPTVKGRRDGRCSSQPGKTTATSTTASRPCFRLRRVHSPPRFHPRLMAGENFRVGWRRVRPEQVARTTVYPCDARHRRQHPLPCTHEASWTPNPESTHRTNGALAGHQAS